MQICYLRIWETKLVDRDNKELAFGQINLSAQNLVQYYLFSRIKYYILYSKKSNWRFFLIAWEKKAKCRQIWNRQSNIFITKKKKKKFHLGKSVVKFWCHTVLYNSVYLAKKQLINLIKIKQKSESSFLKWTTSLNHFTKKAVLSASNA